jgi:hypothetical protein
MPTDWGASLGANFRGRVLYQRNFNCPTALEPHESVYLVVEGVDCLATIELNQKFVGGLTLASGPGKFDITPRLLPRNDLRIEVALPLYTEVEEFRTREARIGLPGGLFGEVRLEICSGN